MANIKKYQHFSTNSDYGGVRELQKQNCEIKHLRLQRRQDKQLGQGLSVGCIRNMYSYALQFRAKVMALNLNVSVCHNLVAKGDGLITFYHELTYLLQCSFILGSQI